MISCQSYVHTSSRNESVGMTQAWQPNKRCSLCKTVTSENVSVFSLLSWWGGWGKIARMIMNILNLSSAVQLHDSSYKPNNILYPDWISTLVLPVQILVLALQHIAFTHTSRIKKRSRNLHLNVTLNLLTCLSKPRLRAVTVCPHL